MSETLIIYKAEEFDALPLETQKMIKSLSDDLNVKQLSVFNPLVEAMAIIEGFNELSYEADNEECIEQYKEAKKFVGSFNSSTKKAKSTLKKPFLETGKKLDKIEKTFLERAKEVMEKVNEEFKPYLDEKAEKARLAEEKKNKASLDKIAELNEQSVEQSLVIERSKIYNSYLNFNQSMLDGIIEKVDSYSEDALKTLLEGLNEKELGIPQEHENILFEDQVENLTVSFNKMKETCIRMIKMRLSEIEADKAPTPTSEAPAPTFTVPSIESPQSFGKSFMEIMKVTVANIELLPVITDKEKKAKLSVIGGLQGYTLKILNYIDDGQDN
jgi:hypothetical protein